MRAPEGQEVPNWASLLNSGEISTGDEIGFVAFLIGFLHAKLWKHAESAANLYSGMLLPAPLLVIPLWTACTQLILKGIKAYGFC